jgi:hypothetical protein
MNQKVIGNQMGIISQKQLRKKSDKQLIIEKFCKIPIDWPSEMKITDQLLSEYPDNAFWFSLKKPTKCNSMVYFLTFEGQNYIKRSIKLGNLDIIRDRAIELNKESLIDIKIETKPKTILEFLKQDYGKK